MVGAGPRHFGQMDDRSLLATNSISTGVIVRRRLQQRRTRWVVELEWCFCIALFFMIPWRSSHLRTKNSKKQFSPWLYPQTALTFRLLPPRHGCAGPVGHRAAQQTTFRVRPLVAFIGTVGLLHWSESSYWAYFRLSDALLSARTGGTPTPEYCRRLYYS